MTAANTHIRECYLHTTHVKKGILFFSPYNKEIGKDTAMIFFLKDFRIDIPVLAQQQKVLKYFKVVLKFLVKL